MKISVETQNNIRQQFFISIPLFSFDSRKKDAIGIHVDP